MVLSTAHRLCTEGMTHEERNEFDKAIYAEPEPQPIARAV